MGSMIDMEFSLSGDMCEVTSHAREYCSQFGLGRCARATIYVFNPDLVSRTPDAM